MTRAQAIDLGLHVGRIAFSSAAFVALARVGLLVPAMVASAALFFAVFATVHDLAHGALGLPRRANRALLATLGAVMLVSGHALRAMHLVHHARPLADDDLEGRGAQLSFVGALLHGPRNLVALRVAAYRRARPAERARQVREHAAVLALAGGLLLLGGAGGAIHVGVALGLQLTMTVWASHVPHRAPRWLTDLAARLAFTRSPVVLSLAFHERHHARPAVPCQRLGDAVG